MEVSLGMFKKILFFNWCGGGGGGVMMMMIKFLPLFWSITLQKCTFLDSCSGPKAGILHNQHAQLARTKSVEWWMTFNTLWTQQMLNILISRLGAHTHTPAALATTLNGLSLRRSKSNLSTPTMHIQASFFFLPSSPFFCLYPSVVGPQPLEMPCMSLSGQQKQQQCGTGYGQTSDLMQPVLPFGKGESEY